MNHRLKEVLARIEEEFKGQIQKGARNYIEVDVGAYAGKMGYADLAAACKNVLAIVPLREPKAGMKVRIDGRTFVDYAEVAAGIAVPGYLARKMGPAFKAFIPNDSMICNFA